MNHQPTTKAGIIVTFYGARGKIEPLTNLLGEPLGLVIQAFPNRQYLSDKDHYVRYFYPTAAHDTTVVLLALSAEGEAHVVWQALAQKLNEKVQLKALLERVIAQHAAQSVLWGYNVIYHAALAEDSTPNEHTLQQLLPLARRPDMTPWDKPEWLAHTVLEEQGPQLWLMDIPDDEGGALAATVYAALSPLDKEDDMITQILYGPAAALLMPDLIAHKSYFQMRQVTEELRTSYKEQLNKLRDNIRDLLDAKQTNSAQSPPDLADLSTTYARLLLATSGFDDLRIGLAQQEENYRWWEEELGSGNVADYHKQQMRTGKQELTLLIDSAQRILDAARTTIEMVEARLNQTREKRENKMGALIAILGIGLAVSQIIDPQAAKALLTIQHMTFSVHDRLIQLLVQLAVTVVLTGIIYWLYKKFIGKVG